MPRHGSMARNNVVTCALIGFMTCFAGAAYGSSITADSAPQLAAQALQNHDADAERSLGLYAEKNGAIKSDGVTPYTASMLYKNAIKDGNDVAVVDLHRLATQGDVDALVSLGTLYLQGVDGTLPQDEAEAVRLFSAAARKGSPVASFNLGNAELAGVGTPQDVEAGCENILDAAKDQFAPAIRSTLSCLDHMSSDYALKAYNTFKMLQDKSPVAKLAYAQMLLRSEPFDPNPEKSLNTFLSVYLGSDDISDQDLAWDTRAIAEIYKKQDNFPRFIAFMRKAAAYGDKRAPDDILGSLVANGAEPDVIKNIILNGDRSKDEQKILDFWKRVRAFDIKPWRCGAVPWKGDVMNIFNWRNTWLKKMMVWQNCTIRHINGMKEDLRGFDQEVDRYPFNIPETLRLTIRSTNKAAVNEIGFETHQLALALDAVNAK